MIFTINKSANELQNLKNIFREYKTAEYQIKSTLPFKCTLKKVYKNKIAPKVLTLDK